MALIILEEFKAGVRSSELENGRTGIALQLVEHDLPGLEGSPVVISFGPEAAEAIYEAMGEALGKVSEIVVAGAHEMPKEGTDGAPGQAA